MLVTVTTRATAEAISAPRILPLVFADNSRGSCQPKKKNRPASLRGYLCPSGSFHCAAIAESITICEKCPRIAGLRAAPRGQPSRAKLFITPARTVSVEDNVDSVADNGSAGRGARGGGAHSAMRPLSPTPGGRMARTVSASGSVFPDATNTTDFT